MAVELELRVHGIGDHKALSAQGSGSTCGSPLCSLYGRFFPRRFGVAAHDEVREHVRSWGNFWRDTDPIAGPLRGHTDPSVVDIQVPDGLDEERPIKGHGDYWIDDHQLSWIASLPG